MSDQVPPAETKRVTPANLMVAAVTVVVIQAIALRVTYLNFPTYYAITSASGSS